MAIKSCRIKAILLLFDLSFDVLFVCLICSFNDLSVTSVPIYILNMALTFIMVIWWPFQRSNSCVNIKHALFHNKGLGTFWGIFGLFFLKVKKKYVCKCKLYLNNYIFNIDNFIADVIAVNVINDVKICRKRHKRKKWTKTGKIVCVFYI